MVRGGIIEAATVLVSVRAVWILIFHFLMSNLAPWCRRGWSLVDQETILKLTRPSLAAFSMTISNAVGLQGMILTIGWFMGPASAAIFGTVRMLSRAPLQFSGLLSRASIPELTRAYEAKNTQLTQKLMRLNISAALLVMLPSSIILIMYGPSILSTLSHGNLIASRVEFILMSLAMLCVTIWTTLAAPLIATNQQAKFSRVILLAYCSQTLVPIAFSSFQQAPYFAVLGAELTSLLWIARIIRKNPSSQ